MTMLHARTCTRTHPLQSKDHPHVVVHSDFLSGHATSSTHDLMMLNIPTLPWEFVNGEALTASHFS
jgi:hypothetical protein